MLVDWIYSNPPWLVTAVFVFCGVAAASASMVVVRLIAGREPLIRYSPLTEFTVTNIAVLYAVLLAFIAIATWDSFSRASDLVQTEANLLGDFYRDTQGLPPGTGDSFRGDVVNYLHTVLDKEWPLQRHGEIPEQGSAQLEMLVGRVATLTPNTRGEAVVMQELFRTINELNTARMSRLEAVQGHIPDMVWAVLVLVGALTIGYTCFLGADGVVPHLFMIAGLTAALTLVIALIVELDHPFRGMIGVSPEPYQLLLDQINGHRMMMLGHG